MKRVLLSLCMLSFSALAFGQSPFDGTWKMDLESAKFQQRPTHYLLQNGMFQCVSCVHMKINVKADGKDQPLQSDGTSSAYADHVNVRVVDENSVNFTYKLNGQVMSEEDDTVSADGNSMSQKNADYSEDRANPAKDEWEFTRVSAGPAGAHKISGEWRATKISNVTSNESSLTFQSTPGGIKMTDPNGWGFDAKFDGKPVAAMKDPGHTMVTLKKVDDRTIEVTQNRAGKVVGIMKVQVAADGTTMQTDFSDPSAPGSNQVVDWKKQ